MGLCHRLLLLPLKEVNRWLRLALLLLVLLRLLPLPLPLYWLRGNEMMVLGYRVARSQGTLRALRQAIRLTPGVGRPSSVQDVPPTPPIFKVPGAEVDIAITTAPPPPHVLLV